MNSAEWIPGVAAMGAGLIGGLILAWRTRKGTPLPSTAVSEREELERQRDALYESIRAMEMEKPRMDEEAWTAEKEKLEIEAAKVLMALHLLAETKVEPTKPRPESIGSRHPQLVGAAWGAGVMLFLGALYLGLQENMTPRAENGSLTGNKQLADNPPEEEKQPEEAISPEEEAALAALKQKADAAPEDVVAQNAYAHALIRVNKLMEAWQISEKIVAKDQNNVEARTHQGIVLLAINEAETAAGLLDKVLTIAPDNTEALAYRGLLYLRGGSPDKAIETWDKAIAADPAQAEVLKPLIAMAKNPSAMPPFMQNGAAPAASGGAITGTIEADPTLAATVAPGTTIFVVARPAGSSGGRPIAAKRIAVDHFPVQFSLSAADNPMGGSFSGSVVLTAIIDRDGDISTHDANDLRGQSNTVDVGATGVTITLGEAGSVPAATAPAAPSTGSTISGTLQAPGKTIPAGSKIFVYARSPGQEHGMPLAVVRMVVDTLPADFTLGAGDSPMGGGLTGPVVVTARWDSDGDGNPTTKSPTDLEARSGTVTPGTSGIQLSLAPPAP